MAAFMCSDLHISSLVNAAAQHELDQPFGFRDRTTEPEAFALLVQENAKSIVARYGKRPAGEMIRSSHRYISGTPALSAIAVIKLAHCYDYQSCEHDGWGTSEAKKWIDLLIAALVYKIPGYDKAEWAI
jgi:hypothetical protein